MTPSRLDAIEGRFDIPPDAPPYNQRSKDYADYVSWRTSVARLQEEKDVFYLLRIVRAAVKMRERMEQVTSPDFASPYVPYIVDVHDFDAALEDRK